MLLDQAAGELVTVKPRSGSMANGMACWMLRLRQERFEQQLTGTSISTPRSPTRTSSKSYSGLFSAARGHRNFLCLSETFNVRLSTVGDHESRLQLYGGTDSSGQGASALLACRILCHPI